MVSARIKRVNAHKLMMIVPSAYPLGGVANWLDYLVPGLEHFGWNVSVGLTSGRFHNVQAYVDHHSFNQVTKISCGSGTQEGRLLGLCRAIRSVDPAIVAFVNVPDTGIAANRLRIRGEFSGRVVLVNHGIQHDLFADMRLLKQSLDAVVCTNRLSAALATFVGGIEESRVHFCPYGTEVPTIPPPLKHRVKGRPLHLGYFGRFEQDQKRVLDLAPIAAELQRRGVYFELWLAGGGPDEAALRATLANATTAPIHFLGEIPAAEMQARAIDCVDVLLLTSEWETGPLIIWEAMASGVPVVTSRYVGSGLEGSLSDGNNCLIFPVGDAYAAADRIAKLADVIVARNIALRAFDLVSGRYSHKASIAGWHAALEKILASASLPARPSRTLAIPSLYSRGGRLDHLLGRSVAERLRVVLRRQFRHTEPGGEWPHTLSAVDPRSSEFWRLTATLDEAEASSGPESD